MTLQHPAVGGADKDPPHRTWIVRVGQNLASNELLCTIDRFLTAGIEMHSVVAVVEDLPTEGLVCGQVGTVVEKWAPGVFEVEFSDQDGRAYAMVALKAEQLMRLHHEPVHEAA